jgi:hypothetical protein
MLGQSPHPAQADLLKTLLAHQLNPQHPLYLLGQAIPCKKLEKKPSHRLMGVWATESPYQQMASLLILKHLYNLSDERVVASLGKESLLQLVF